MNAFSRNLVLTAHGAATSFLTALLLYFVDSRCDVSLYSFMLWFIVPVGAIGAGLVASSGYYAGARERLTGSPTCR